MRIDDIRDVLKHLRAPGLSGARSAPVDAAQGARGRDDLLADLAELAHQYGRYSCRKITALLRGGRVVIDKRVTRISRLEGLKVPVRQPIGGRRRLGDGPCIPMRLRPERRDRVWSYDFVGKRTHDGRRLRTLDVMDEFTHECRRLGSLADAPVQ